MRPKTVTQVDGSSPAQNCSDKRAKMEPPPLRTDGKPLRRYKPKPLALPKQHVPPAQVRAIREALDMTQEMFAYTFGIPLRALRLWEYGKRGARGAPATLLLVISSNATAVKKALRRKH